MWPPGSANTVCPRPPLTLTFDRLTLKLVCESHLRWGTFVPNFGTLGLWVLELFATDGETDGRTGIIKQEQQTGAEELRAVLGGEVATVTEATVILWRRTITETTPMSPTVRVTG